MDAVDEKIKDAERREEAMAGHLTTLRDAYKAVAADYRRRPRRKCDLGGRITLEEVRSYATTADSLVALFAAAHDLLLAAESPLPVQTCLGYSGKSPALAAEDAVVEGVRRRAREKRVACEACGGPLVPAYGDGPGAPLIGSRCADCNAMVKHPRPDAEGTVYGSGEFVEIRALLPKEAADALGKLRPGDISLAYPAGEETPDPTAALVEALTTALSSQEIEAVLQAGNRLHDLGFGELAELAIDRNTDRRERNRLIRELRDTRAKLEDELHKALEWTGAQCAEWFMEQGLAGLLGEANARGENARCIVVADDERVPQVIRRWSGQWVLVHGLPVRKESRPGQHVIALDVAAPVAAAEATEDAPGEDAACPEGGEGNE